MLYNKYYAEVVERNGIDVTDGGSIPPASTIKVDKCHLIK
jgi:hypothetical protein